MESPTGPQDLLPDTPPYTIKGHTCCIGDVKCGLFTVRRCYNVAGSVNYRRDVIGHDKGGEGSGGGEGGLVGDASDGGDTDAYDPDSEAPDADGAEPGEGTGKDPEVSQSYGIVTCT